MPSKIGKVLLVLAISGTLLTGCSVRGFFSGDQLIERDIEGAQQWPLSTIFGRSTFQTISTKGERRLVIFRDSDEEYKKGPDLGQEIATAVTAGTVLGAVTNIGTSAGAALGLAAEIGEQIVERSSSECSGSKCKKCSGAKCRKCSGSGCEDDPIAEGRMVCAEPSPDLAEAVFQALAGGLERQDSTATIAAILQTVPEVIYKRSHGVQFYRDSSFALCQAAMNGLVGKTKFHEMLKASRETAKEMVIGEMVRDALRPPPADQPKTSLADRLKELSGTINEFDKAHEALKKLVK